MRAQKRWVRDCINQRNNDESDEKVVASEVAVCKSGTHRSPAAMRIVAEMLRGDGIAFFRPKHLSWGVWKSRGRCWWCDACHLDNPAKVALSDGVYELWKTL